MKKTKWLPGKKPKKYLVYIPEIQEKIYKAARSAVEKQIEDINSRKNKGKILKVTAYGSVIRREAGIYDKKYKIVSGKSRYGSDLDAVFIVEKDFEVPKKWKYMKSYEDWYEEYTIDLIENYVEEIKKKDAPVNPINAIVMRVGVNNFKNSVEHIGFDENESRKRGFKVELWYLDKERFSKIRLN